MNVGEQLVSDYLECIKECDFIQKNLQIPENQGEIDVIGINLKNKEIFVCEVAIHLTSGLQYTKSGKPNNVDKICEKMSRDIEYTHKYFPDYKQHFMFWTPVVKNTPNAKNNQMKDVRDIKARILEKYDEKIDFIINQEFLNKMYELRAYTKEQTKELKSPVLRMLQIEEHLKKFTNKKSSEIKFDV